MESAADRKLRLLTLVYRGLLIFLVFLGLLFIGGTVYGVVFRASSQKNEPVDSPRKSGEAQTFTGIGRIRASTTGSEPGTVIVFVSFVYYPEDRAFSEELALRVRDFRQIIEDYIGSFSVSELRALEEDSVKTEILRRLNAILRLGQIEVLYFSDFMIVG